jgi:microcystin degradation protein MlrC
VLLEQLTEALRGQHLRTPNGQLLAGVLHGQLEAVDELLQGDGAGLDRDGRQLIQHVLDPRNGDDVVLALEADPPAAELALGPGEGAGKEFRKGRPVTVV